MVMILDSTLQRYPYSLPVKIVGTSMQPDIMDGDVVLVDSSAIRPKRDDVVSAYIHGQGALCGRFRRTKTGDWIYKNNPEDSSYPRVALGSPDRYFIAGTVRMIIERGDVIMQRDVTPAIGNTEHLTSDEIQTRMESAAAFYRYRLARARSFADAITSPAFYTLTQKPGQQRPQLVVQ